MVKFVQGKYTHINLPRVRLPLVMLARVILPSPFYKAIPIEGQSYQWKTYLCKVTWVRILRKSYPGKVTGVKLSKKAYLGEIH